MMRITSRKSSSLVVLSLFAAMRIGLACAQQPTAKSPTQDQAVRLKSELVELRAVVTDKKGQPVDNLKQTDFQVFEGGVHQDISFFSLERVQGGSKTSEAAGKPTARDSFQPPAPGAAPARTIVLFVDALHLSTFSFINAKKQLKRFVDEQITDQDLAAVVTTGSSLGVLQQFMRDRKMLKYAIDKITRIPKSDSVFTPYLAAAISREDSQAIAVGVSVLTAEEGPLPPNPEGIVRARAMNVIAEEANFRQATLITLRAVCDRLTEMPGQRMIAFLSDGFTLLEEGGSADTQTLTNVTGRARSEEHTSELQSQR